MSQPPIVMGQPPIVMGTAVNAARAGGVLRAQNAYSLMRKIVFWAVVVAATRLALLTAMFGVAIFKHTESYDKTDVTAMMKTRNERDSWVGPRGLAEYVIDIIIAALISFILFKFYRGVRRNEGENIQSLANFGTEVGNIVTHTRKATKDMSSLTAVSAAPLNALGFFTKPLLKSLKSFFSK